MVKLLSLLTISFVILALSADERRGKGGDTEDSVTTENTKDRGNRNRDREDTVTPAVTETPDRRGDRRDRDRGNTATTEKPDSRDDKNRRRERQRRSDIPRWKRQLDRRNRKNLDGTMDVMDCDLGNLTTAQGPVTWGGCILWSATFPGITYTGEEDMEFDILYTCDKCFQNGMGALTPDHPGRSYGRYNCGDWDVWSIKESCANDPHCIGKYKYVCDRSSKLFDRYVM